MNIYSLLRLYTKIQNRRIKAFGLIVLHIFHRRYTCMFLDPIEACNLRCRMCYFSDMERRKSMRGMFSSADLEAWGRSVFPHLLKLQIGCGAEPTLYKSLPDIVKMGREYGVPYISITTNGNLLDFSKLDELAKSGLNELTLSLHGIKKSTYEYFMQGAKFEKFLDVVEALKAIKKLYPSFKIRVNYTVNEDNVEDLADFQQLFDGLQLDVVQLRPVQDLGDSDYKNFSMDKVLACYESHLLKVVDYCDKHDTVCLYPSRENILSLMTHTEEENTNHTNNAVDLIPHLYAAPWENWKEQFDPYKESFYGYCRRTHRLSHLWSCVFSVKSKKQEETTKSMNYQIK